MAKRYEHETADERLTQVMQETVRLDVVDDEQGAIGYILLWLMGVPASLLFVVFLLRGCN